MCSINECEILVKEIVTKDPKLQRLLGVGQEQWNIACKTCTNNGVEGKARAFITADPNQIILCANRLASEKAIKESLIHEAVHAYDYSQKRCDFYSCEGLAYTEVRAAREAECSRYFPFEWFKEYCIKSRAANSTSNLFPNGARKCVDTVYKEAVSDLHPLPLADDVSENGESTSINKNNIAEVKKI